MSAQTGASIRGKNTQIHTEDRFHEGQHRQLGVEESINDDPEALAAEMSYLCQVGENGLGGRGAEHDLLVLPLPPLAFGGKSVFLRSRRSLTEL